MDAPRNIDWNRLREAIRTGVVEVTVDPLEGSMRKIHCAASPDESKDRTRCVTLLWSQRDLDLLESALAAVSCTEDWSEASRDRARKIGDRLRAQLADDYDTETGHDWLRD